MQTYRDNIKKIPCQTAADPVTSNTRLPFSKVGRGRNCQNTNSELGTDATKLNTKMQSPTPSLEPTSTSALLRQNLELRQRLTEETSCYRRRIDTYKQAQQNQAMLVSRLQSKIQQYRQRCTDLEERMQETVQQMPLTDASVSRPKINTGPTTSQVICSTSLGLSGQTIMPCSSSLESQTTPPCARDFLVHEDSGELCRKLDDEQNKCAHIIAQNNVLRQQLEESNRTNEALTNDLQKLTNDWSNLRDELMVKEDEYKEEEQAFKDYYNSEHNRLLKMWREVVAIKRTFKDMQAATKNDVAKMSLEVTNANRDVSTACNSTAFTLQQIRRQTDEQLLQAKRANDELQTQLAVLKVQHESARHEVLERDQRLVEFMNQLKKLEERCALAESQATLANRYNDEIERLNASMREIAQAVVLDAEHSEQDDTTNGTTVLLARGSASVTSTAGAATPRNKSPHRSTARASQAFAEGTISAVQAALHKYQLALHDMQVKLQNTNEQLRSTKSQLETSEGTKQLLTTKIHHLTEKMDNSNSKLSELLKERDSLQKALEEIRTQKQQAEQGRAEINNAVNSFG